MTTPETVVRGAYWSVAFDDEDALASFREVHARLGSTTEARDAMTAAGWSASVHALHADTGRYVQLLVGYPDAAPALEQDPLDALPATWAAAIRYAACSPIVALEHVRSFFTFRATEVHEIVVSWIPLNPDGPKAVRRAAVDAQAQDASREETVERLRARTSYASVDLVAPTAAGGPALVTLVHAERARSASVGAMMSAHPADRARRHLLATHARVEEGVTFETLAAIVTP